MLKLGVMLAAWVSASSVLAADAAYQVLSPAPYAAEARVPAAVRNECTLEQYVGEEITRAVAGSYPGSAGQAKLNGTEPRALRLSITTVDAVGGGIWSGHKGLTVKAEFVEQGKAVDSKLFHRRTGGGPGGMFKGNCSLLERNADSIGKDIVRWLLTHDQKALHDNSEDVAVIALPGQQSTLAFGILPVAFAPELSVPAAVHQECKLEAFFSDELSNRARASFPATTSITQAPASGAALRVLMDTVDAPGGGNWSGAKELGIRVEWIEAGQVVDGTQFSRKAGRFLGNLRNTCSLLEHVARGLSSDVLHWVLQRNSKTVVPVAQDGAPGKS